MHLDQLETPAVLVDLDIMERNLTRMAEYCRQHGVRLRPHAKTHKIPELAARQVASGAVGISMAKLGEAEIMADAGIKDILVAYPIVGRDKAARLARLAERVRISVSLDSIEAAEAISAEAQALGVQIGVMAEIDVGFRRCGFADPDLLVDLARRINDLPGLEFLGLMFFPGQFVVGPEQRAIALTQVNDLLDRVYTAFDQTDLPVSIVSGGSTPTAFSAHLFHGVNEVRPGMYLFNDRNMIGLQVAAPSDCALSVLVTVVSTSVNGRAVLDGGSKTFSGDRYLAGDNRGFGLVREDPTTEFEAMTEEHGHLDISRSSRQYRVGERLTVIPNHVCTTINMHDEIYGIRGDRVETTWRVAARGKVR